MGFRYLAVSNLIGGICTTISLSVISNTQKLTHPRLLAPVDFLTHAWGYYVEITNKLMKCLLEDTVCSEDNSLLIVSPGRFPYPGPSSDNAVWMMGSANWASISLHLGEVSTGCSHPSSACTHAHKSSKKGAQ